MISSLKKSFSNLQRAVKHKNGIVNDVVKSGRIVKFSFGK